MWRFEEWALGAATAAMVMVTIGCGPGQQGPRRIATPTASTATATEGTPAKADETEERVHRAHSMLNLIEVLPDDTLAVVLGHDLFDLAERLGRSTLITRFPEEYEEFVGEMVENTGVNLTTPGGLEEVGLDPHGPAGAAVIWPDRSVFGFLFTVASRSKLRRSAHRWESPELELENLGSTLLLLPLDEKDLAILVEGNTALLLVSDGGKSAHDVVRELAQRESGQRLANSERFRATLEELPRNGDGLFYMSPAGVVERLESRFGPRSIPLIPEIQGMGCALKLRPGELGCDLRVHLSQGSALRRMAETARRSPAGGPPILQGLDEEPGFVMHASLDPDVAADELRKALGPDWSMLGTELGIDVDNQFIPVIDGSFGIAVSLRDRGPRPKTLPSDEFWDRDNPLITIMVGLRDVPGMRRLLTQLTSPKAGRKLVRSGRDFKAPSRREGPFFGIRGETLVVTNDEPHLKSITSPTQARGTWSWPTPGKREPLILGYNLGRIFLSAWASGSSRSLPAAVPATPHVATDSAAVRAKRRELEKLQRELEKLEEAHDEQVRRLAERIRTKLGSFWLTLGSNPAGLSGHAAYRIPDPSFGEALADIVGLGKERSELSRQHYEGADALDEKISEKEREIAEIRAREAAGRPQSP